MSLKDVEIRENPRKSLNFPTSSPWFRTSTCSLLCQLQQLCTHRHLRGFPGEVVQVLSTTTVVAIENVEAPFWMGKSHSWLEITMFNGKIHYKWQFSIAMLNYQRVNHIAGWWYTYRSPLKNHGVKVSWDDDIPHIWKKKCGILILPREMAIGIPWDMHGNGISIILIIPMVREMAIYNGYTPFFKTNCHMDTSWYMYCPDIDASSRLMPLKWILYAVCESDPSVSLKGLLAYIWVNYHISLTWINAIKRDDSPKINHDSQWGRYKLVVADATAHGWSSQRSPRSHAVQQTAAPGKTRPPGPRINRFRLNMLKKTKETVWNSSV